jgi:WD40 repeat protein
MASTDQTVRVFISSTFRDMHAERDHLVTVVFPELRERVERLGLEFFDVDLRWGVPAKDANGETANSWEYCRQWIDRVEPFFVCILGQRYGWEPEPEQLKDLDDRKRQQAQKRSITDMEVRHGVLSRNLSRRSYFYLRADEAPASASEFVDPPPLLDKLKLLKDEIRSCGRPVRSYPCQWTGEGFTEMEQFGRLVLDDLWSGVLRDERYVSKEVWRQALGADPDTDPIYAEESQPVPRELWEKIVESAKPEPRDPLYAEREQMDAFAVSRLRWFQGRTHELQQLSDFLNDPAKDAPHLAVVAAVPGQGKSALLAKLLEQLKASPPPRTPRSWFRFWAKSKPQFVITHFVGATERSASAHALVQRLLDELDRSGIRWPSEQQEGQEPKRDFNSLCLRLAQWLGDYAGERRIVILLDALNQLSDGYDLQWLPTRLGPSVRVIASCVEDDAAKANGPEQRVLQALVSRRSNPLRVKLQALTQEDVRTIVIAYLDEYCKVLDTVQVDAICALPQARNPLYLLVMLGELRTLGGNDMNRIVGELIASMPQDHPDTVSLFRWVLQRLEVFGSDAVQWWCLYLAHGRVGMSSHELADLLARKLGQDAAAKALLIERGLRRYLQHRGPMLDFFHGQLRQAVFEQYGPRAETPSVHSDIATYFRDLADPESNQIWKGGNPRPFLEVVFHLAAAQRLDELCETLCAIHFVEARCRHGQVFELIADYTMAQEHLPEAQEELRKERERQARLARWTEEITVYSRQWSDRRDRLARGEVVCETEPQLPDPPASCRMWTEEEIEVERKRIVEDPMRLDRIKAFAGFVEQECYPLLEFGTRHGFVVQQAFNHAPRGPVHEEAKENVGAITAPMLLRHWLPGSAYNPKPALLRTLEGHIDDVNSVCMTPDGRRAVSGSGNLQVPSASKRGTVRVWDLETGKCLHTLEGHRRGVSSVSVTPDGRRAVSASMDKTLRVWDLETGVCMRVLKGHRSRRVNCVSVTPDGRRAISVSGNSLGWDSRGRVWDLETGKCVRMLKGFMSKLTGVSMTPDGRRAVSSSYDYWPLNVWDLETGEGVHLQEHYGLVNSVSMTPDGRLAVAAGWNDRTIRVWDVDVGVCLQVLKGHTDGNWFGVRSVAVTPDGRRAVSAGDDQTVRVWDLDAGTSLRTLKGHSYDVSSVSVTPDGRRAVSAGGRADHTIRVWDLESGECDTSEGRSRRVARLSVTPDGRWAVSGGGYECARVWDLETGALLHTLESKVTNSLSVTPDGRRVVLGGWRFLSVWDLETGVLLNNIEVHDDYDFHCLCVTPDGLCVVAGGGDPDYSLRVWNLETGKCLRMLKKTDRSYVEGLSVTPDGRRAVSTSDYGTLRMWDLETGKCLRVMWGHTNRVTSVSLTPDGRCAVSASVDKTLREWNLETGTLLRTLEAHSNDVNSVSLAPDGRYAVSASEDNTLRLWDLEAGADLAVAYTQVPISATAISPTTCQIIAGNGIGEVLQFDLHCIPVIAASQTS